MSRASLIQTSFIGGEFSRGARARHDIAAHPNALEICRNAVVRPTGAADKRGGWVHLGFAKAATGTAWWFVFRKSTTDIVRIHICDGKLRFWNGITRAQVLDGGGLPYEVNSPWTADQLQGLRFWQSGDVMFFAHTSGLIPTKVLKRLAANSWTIADYVFEEGPFMAAPKNNPLLVLAPTGFTTAFATTAAFAATDVDRLIRVEAETFDGDVQAWAFDNLYVLGDIVRHGNNFYEAVQVGADNKSGDAPPLHSSGVAWDGNTRKVRWQFAGHTYGLMRVDAYVSPTVVDVEVLQRLPFYGVSASQTTSYWQLGAFGETPGYPRAGTLHEERIVALGNTIEPDTTFLSRSAGYTADGATFRPPFPTEVLDDDAVRRTMADGEVNLPVWALSLDVLLVGTTGGVKRISPPSPDEPLTPAGASTRTLVAIPCSELVRPVTTPTSFIFVPLHETELIEVQRKDQIEPRNLFELADHLIAAGIRQLAFSRKPSNVLWVLDAEGQLVSITYSPENGVFACSAHPGGGTLDGEAAETDDICSATGPYRSEELWRSVLKTVDGVTVRAIEYMERIYNPRRMRLEDACVLDAAGYFDQWNSDAGKTMTFTPDPGDPTIGVLTSAGHTPFLIGHVGKTIFLRKVKPTPRASDVRWPVSLTITGYTAADTVDVRTDGDFGGLLAGEAVVQWAFAVTTLAGLDWLEGEVVRVNGDGGDYGPDEHGTNTAAWTVTGGEIVLPEPCARGWVGLPYRQQMRTLPINAGEASGAGRGAVKRIDRFFVMIDGAAAGVVQRVGSTEAGIAIAGRDNTHFMGAAPPPVEDDAWESVPGGWDREGQMDFFNDSALPAGISGFVMRVTTNG